MADMAIVSLYWGLLTTNHLQPVYTCMNGQGIVFKNVPPPFTLATIKGVSITHAASSQLAVVAMAISQFVKFKVQTACVKQLHLSSFVYTSTRNRSGPLRTTYLR